MQSYGQTCRLDPLHELRQVDQRRRDRWQRRRLILAQPAQDLANVGQRRAAGPGDVGQRLPRGPEVGFQQLLGGTCTTTTLSA